MEPPDTDLPECVSCSKPIEGVSWTPSGGDLHCQGCAATIEDERGLLRALAEVSEKLWERYGFKVVVDPPNVTDRLLNGYIHVDPQRCKVEAFNTKAELRQGLAFFFSITGSR